MMFDATRKRAARLLAASIWLFGSGFVALAQLASHGAAPPLHIASNAEGLRFFTIKDRLAALRGESASKRPVSQSEEAPRAEEIGLRLTHLEPPAALLLRSIPFAVPGGDLAAKWRAAMQRWQREQETIASCEGGGCANPAVRRWHDIRRIAAGRQGRDRLLLVHDAINHAISYRTDSLAFGRPDYWATPLETLTKWGDCEDYVIAKFLMLRSLEVDIEEMKLVALREDRTGEYHAILAVRSAGEWLFMDNKRGVLTRESDYADTTPLALVDDSGQSMLVVTAPLRLTMK